MEKPIRNWAKILSWLPRVTGSMPTGVYGQFGGPLTGAAVRAGLLGGTGWLYGRYVHPVLRRGDSDEDPRDTARRMALIGAGVGAATGLPSVLRGVRAKWRHIMSMLIMDADIAVAPEILRPRFVVEASAEDENLSAIYVCARKFLTMQNQARGLRASK